MNNIGEIGFIEYKDKLTKVKIKEVHGNYYVVETEDDEILGIPPESYTYIWKNEEAYRHYKDWAGCQLVPQDN